MSNLRLHLLGAPQLTWQARPIPVERRKGFALLAYLALTPGAQRRDTLAALLWPGYDATTARGNLRRTLSELRKVLPPDTLWVEREAVELPRRDDLWVDAVAFQDHLEAVRRHAHTSPSECEACRARLHTAVALYRDDFLAGFTLADSAGFDTWQLLQTEQYRRFCDEALDGLVQRSLAAGDLPAAFTYAQRRLALDLLNEEAHRQLMQIYAWSGDRSAALRQYDECVHLLQKELVHGGSNKPRYRTER